jgi:hypothetical protein
MAFGIDDALMAAAAGINLTETLVETIRRHKGNRNIDIERLIEEVRITALARLDDADLALTQFERTLVEKGVDLSKTLQEAINSTAWWLPFEQHRLKRFRQSFNVLADAAYMATDDVAALLRCRDQTGEMGKAVVESALTKHALSSDIINAHSVGDAIDRLRKELVRQKAQLT